AVHAAPAAPAKPGATGQKAPVPTRKRTEVLLPLATSVPAELVPMKSGTTMKVTPANLQAALRVGPLLPVTALCFNADGTRLFVGAYGRVEVWDLAQGRILKALDGVEGAVHDLELSPDGKQLAAGGGKPSQAGSVLLYDAADPGKPTARFEGHTDVVYRLTWSPDGKRLASAGFDKAVQVWDVAAPSKPAVSFRDHTDAVLAVAFSPDGKLLASGGRDKSVKLFDSTTGKSLRTLTGHNEDVSAIAVSADGKSIISTGPERVLRWWETESGKVTRNQGGHGGDVFEIRRSSDGKQLLTVSRDQTARLWDGVSGGQQKVFGAAGEPLYAAAQSADGKRVAAGSASGFVRLWDAVSGRLLVLGLSVAMPGTANELLLATPEGYVKIADPVRSELLWRVGGEPVPGESFGALVKPAEVLKALRGEPVTPVKIPVIKSQSQ
ncbi:MAG: repeat-containing protein, partial [Armatimonadetes bacterium]|nr:repeat-containing protein [Armatimonadota bacterium]